MSETDYVNPLVLEKLAQIQRSSPEDVARQIIELEAKANSDQLTHLLNESGLKDAFVKITDTTKATEIELGKMGITQGDIEPMHLVGFRGYEVTIPDVIGMKAANDDPNQGYTEGNRKLVTVAQCMESNYRRSVDIKARLGKGADEFAIVSVNAKNNREQSEEMYRRFTASLPQDVRVNGAIGWFGPEIPLEEAITITRDRLAEAKKAGPLDEKGRSLGMGGIAFAGEYAKEFQSIHER